MSSLRVVCVSLCLFLLNVRNAVAGPMEISNRYQKGNAVEQNDWGLILSSIESRLKNLDFLYTSQLTPTLETRLEHFQNRISGMEVKLLRVEALLTTKLDRMSDNISSRHFRDDMVQTDMFRKIETAYDGITHRLAYMDRKAENGFLKLQGKSEAISKKLETMGDALTDKYDSIESQLSDVVEGMEDISKSFHNSDNTPDKNTGQHSNTSQQKHYEMQDFARNNPSTDLTKEVRAICENSSKDLELLKEQLNNFTQRNSTEQYLHRFSDDLGRILNEYASKVSDLGAQVTKSDFKISAHLSTIEKVTNSSKAEMQNGLRALMVQVGKIPPKENIRNEVSDQNLLLDVAQKLDTNFEKVISSQNTFLESCHRLQMDESQLEGQISDILNKLIDNFEGTTREQQHLLRKIEGLLVKHDLHVKKELHQANSNIMTVYEHSRKESKDAKDQLKQITDNLEAMFALVQNILGDSKGIMKRGISKEKELVEYIRSLEKALNFTKLEQMKMFDSYKATIETLMTLSQTKQEDEHSSVIMMTNLTQTMTLLREQISNLFKNFNTSISMDILKTVQKTFELVEKNSENIRKISKSKLVQDEDNQIIGSIEEKIKPMKNRSIDVSTTKSDDNTDLDSLIREIFFTNESEIMTSTTTQNPCLDVDIDVRFDSGNNLNNARSTRKCPKGFSEEEIIFPTEGIPTGNTGYLDISIDPRYNQKISARNSNRELGTNMKSETQDLGTQNMETTIPNNTIKNSELIQNVIPFLNITDNKANIFSNKQ